MIFPFIGTSYNGFGQLNTMYYDSTYEQYVKELERLQNDLTNDEFIVKNFQGQTVHFSIGCSDNIAHQIPYFLHDLDKSIVLILIDGYLTINEQKLQNNFDITKVADKQFDYILINKFNGTTITLLGYKTFMPCVFNITKEQHYKENVYGQQIVNQDAESRQFVVKFYDILKTAIELSEETHLYNFAVMINSQNYCGSYIGSHFDFYPKIKQIFTATHNFHLYTWIYPTVNALFRVTREKDINVVLDRCSTKLVILTKEKKDLYIETFLHF